MNVLVLAPGYPTDKNPYSGIYIHEQVMAIKRVDPNIDIEVIKIIPHVPLLIRKIFTKYANYEENIYEYTYAGVHVKILKVFTLPRNLNTPYICESLYKKINKYLNNSKKHYDIIHAHGAVHTGYAAVKNCINRNIKSAVTVHGSDIMYYPDLNKSMKKINYFVLSHADLLLAASSGLKKSIQNRRPKTQVDVLYTGIDFNRFKIIEKNDRIKTTTKFIFVGNILYSKGVFDLIKAFKELVKKGYDCTLSFCGEGKDKIRIHDFCAEMELKNVLFLGSVKNEELPFILSGQDVLVLPSHREGLGTVLIEALAMGKLVIGSNVGGIPEVIDDGVNGFLFQAENVIDLVNSMEKAISSTKNICPKLLRNSIEDRFNIDNNASILIQKYNALLLETTE